MSKSTSWRTAAIAAGAMALAASSAVAQDKELVFGLQCDRTGATQTVGIFLCPGYHDYISLVNSKGGVEGFKIRVLEGDRVSVVLSPYDLTRGRVTYRHK